jgi:hypothetical protein
MHSSASPTGTAAILRLMIEEMSVTNACRLKTSMLLGRPGRVRPGNMVDPKYTMAASVLKEYLVS